MRDISRRRRSSADVALDLGEHRGSVGLQEFAKILTAMVENGVDKRGGPAATEDLVQSLADARTASAMAAQSKAKKRRPFNRNLDLNMEYRGGEGLGRIMSRGPGFMRGSLGPGFNPNKGHRLNNGKGKGSPGGGFSRDLSDKTAFKRRRSNSIGTIPAADGRPEGIRIIHDISTFD